MALAGTVKAAPAGIQGFDTSKLTSAGAQALRQAGFDFSLRYPSRADQEPAGDLTRDEAAAILGAGLALMPVQHAAPEGWEPGADLGTTNGRNAVANAKIVDFPTGINLWLDLERVATDAAVQDVIDYCNAWFAEVDGAGFISGLYVGPQAILNSHQLSEQLRTKHYWKAASIVPPVEKRGYQMVQSLHPKVAGVDIDSDVTMNDAFGDAVRWLDPGA
jgi:hypothetical protein